MTLKKEFNLHYESMSDKALLIEFDKVISPQVNRKVRELMIGLEKEKVEGIEEIVPAYRSLLIHYDPCVLSVEFLYEKVQEIGQNLEQIEMPKPRIFYLPVCYGGDMGPDLAYVADYNNLAKEEVIEIHTSRNYLIYMIGFLVGFPYLGGMSERIATPRLSRPRTKIPVGSVGIAGDQTGIYPLESPGGWRIIGRTPIELYTPQKDPPVLLTMGNFVRFHPIPPAKVHKTRSQVERGEYQVKTGTVEKDVD